MNMKISFINRTVLHLTVRAYLNDNLPRRWIGRASGEDNVMLKWPPRSPDPLQFFSLHLIGKAAYGRKGH